MNCPINQPDPIGKLQSITGIPIKPNAIKIFHNIKLKHHIVRFI